MVKGNSLLAAIIPTMDNTIDNLRNIMSKINRQDFRSELQFMRESHIYAPPYKTYASLPARNSQANYAYPRQISGIEDAGKQKIRIEGNTDGSGQGTTPYAGMPTSGSFKT